MISSLYAAQHAMVYRYPLKYKKPNWHCTSPALSWPQIHNIYDIMRCGEKIRASDCPPTSARKGSQLIGDLTWFCGVNHLWLRSSLGSLWNTWRMDLITMISDVTKNIYQTCMYASDMCCIYTKEIWLVSLSELGAEPEREASFSGFQYLRAIALTWRR